MYIHEKCTLECNYKYKSMCAHWVEYGNSLYAGNFMLLLSSTVFFSKTSFMNTITVSKCLEPDQDRHSVDPDLGPTCLQRLSANDFNGVLSNAVIKIPTFKWKYMR